MSETKAYLTARTDAGSINISEEVIAVIAGTAASETEGVAMLHSSGGRDITQVSGRKTLGRSVKVIFENDNIAIEISIITEPGFAVAKVGEAVQQAVSDAIAGACGITPKYVDVRVAGMRTH